MLECVELAERAGVFIRGNDFKSDQTKLKSVLVDFLVGAGLKPVSIVSYNHLGNNDSKNLSVLQQFCSKKVNNSAADSFLLVNYFIFVICDSFCCRYSVQLSS